MSHKRKQPTPSTSMASDEEDDRSVKNSRRQGAEQPVLGLDDTSLDTGHLPLQSDQDHGLSGSLLRLDTMLNDSGTGSDLLHTSMETADQFVADLGLDPDDPLLSSDLLSSSSPDKGVYMEDSPLSEKGGTLIKKHLCPQCNQKFRNLKHFKQHINIFHPNQFCEMCVNGLWCGQCDINQLYPGFFTDPRPKIQPDPVTSSSQNLVTSAPVTSPSQSSDIQADSSQSKSELQEMCENNVHGYWCDDHCDKNKLDLGFVTDPRPQRSTNQMGGASSDIDSVTMAIINTSTTMPSTISSTTPPRSRQGRASASTTKPRTSSTIGEATVSTSALRSPSETSLATATATEIVPHHAVVTTTPSSLSNARFSAQSPRTSPSTTSTTTPTSNYPISFRPLTSFNPLEKSSTSSVTPLVTSAAPTAAPVVALPAAPSTLSRLPKGVFVIPKPGKIGEIPVMVSQLRPLNPSARGLAASKAPVSSASLSSVSGTSLISVSPSTSASPEKSILGRRRRKRTKKASGETPKPHSEVPPGPASRDSSGPPSAVPSRSVSATSETSSSDSDSSTQLDCQTSHGVVYCKICKKPYAHIKSLRQHMNRAHPQTQPKPTGPECKICNKFFTALHTYEAHMQNFHHVPKPGTPCPHCGKTYKITTKLNMHIEKEHPGLPFVVGSPKYGPTRYQPLSSRTAGSNPLKVNLHVGGMRQGTGAQTLGVGLQPGTRPKTGEDSQYGLGPEGQAVMVCPKCSNQFPDGLSFHAHKQTCLQGTDSQKEAGSHSGAGSQSGAGSHSGAGPQRGAVFVCPACSVVFPDISSFCTHRQTCN